MNSAPHCHLLLTGLPRDFATQQEARLPALRRLLRQAGRQARFAGTWEDWLCKRLGAARQRDWPVAPYAALGEGLDAGHGYWLCASPVCLQPQRDSLLLQDGAADDLDLAQAQLLVQALNAHFAADGLQFFAPHPARWYLRVAAAPQLHTVPLLQVGGRPVNDCLPRGADALAWHRYGNEMQMLLHAHPVNAAREAAGCPPLNAVWLWGGGVLSALPARPDVDIWSDAALARGLAQAGKCGLRPPPADAGAWLARGSGAGTRFAVVQHDQGGDADWSPQHLERAWFAPLLHALGQGRLARLELHLAEDDVVTSCALTRADLWKWWRRLRRPAGSHG